METENCSMKRNEEEKKRKKKNGGEKGENGKEKAREIRLAIEPVSEKRGFSKWWPSTITHGPFKCNSTLFDRAELSRVEPSRAEQEITSRPIVIAPRRLPMRIKLDFERLGKNEVKRKLKS